MMALALAGMARPATALDDGEQLLIGGTSGSGSGVRYGAPGLANTYNDDFPATGLGEMAAQVRMAGGTLRKFRASIVTSGDETSGTVAVMVRVNEADTLLTCSVGIGGGDCGSGGKTIAIAPGDKLAVRVSSTLDTGFWTYSYTMFYD
jgi:hypothetical protein